MPGLHAFAPALQRGFSCAWEGWTRQVQSKPNGNGVATCFQFQGKCKVQLFFHCGISNVTEDRKRYKKNIYMSFTPVDFFWFSPLQTENYTLYKIQFPASVFSAASQGQSRGADRRECLPPCVVPPRCPRWFRGKWRQVMGWSVGNGWQWQPTSSGNSRDGWKKKQPRPVSRNGDLQHVTSN